MRLDSLPEALVECVKACGGSKVVGVMLWPAKDVEAARRHLCACLSDDRPEKLGLDEVMLILKLARERGCHAGMHYLADALSYAKPVPVKPHDEADELRRQVLGMGEQLQRTLARLEQLERTAKGVA